MENTLVPIALFAIVPAIIWAISHYRYKAKSDAAKLLTVMVEKGETVSPETIRALDIRGRSRHADLRTGLVLLAIAFGCFFLGGIIPEEEGQIFMTGLGMFPFLIGLVYVGLWIFISRKETD